MTADKYVFMPCFSIEPNKISTFNKVFYRSKTDNKLKSHHDFTKNRVVKMIDSASKNRVVKSFHGFTISDNAYRNLKRKINWLYYLSKPKTVKTFSGKTIYNFKCAFLTFTLPAKQAECTKDFTNLYFNQLLTELREHFGMLNYVWRLEFQKNGNVHYHLVTDSYVDYFILVKRWNRILSKGYYIESYHNKYYALTLSEYRKSVDPKGTKDFQVIAKRYAKGKKYNWNQPNTVDVKSVISNASISNYLSKYFAKDNNENPIKNELDTEDNSKALRLWFCSRSLSKLKTVTNFCEAVNFSATAIVENVKNVRKKIFRYATVFYFEISKLPALCKKELSQILRRYAHSLNYQPSQ